MKTYLHRTPKYKRQVLPLPIDLGYVESLEMAEKRDDIRKQHLANAILGYGWGQISSEQASVLANEIYTVSYNNSRKDMVMQVALKAAFRRVDDLLRQRYLFVSGLQGRVASVVLPIVKPHAEIYCFGGKDDSIAATCALDYSHDRVNRSSKPESHRLKVLESVLKDPALHLDKAIWNITKKCSKNCAPTSLYGKPVSLSNIVLINPGKYAFSGNSVGFGS